MSTQANTPWACINEVCDYLNISRQTLWRFTKTGLPHSRVGNIVRFKLDDVDTWLGEQH
jgi:excisionase family DNA binding protein